MDTQQVVEHFPRGSKVRYTFIEDDGERSEERTVFEVDRRSFWTRREDGFSGFLPFDCSMSGGSIDFQEGELRFTDYRGILRIIVRKAE